MTLPMLMVVHLLIVLNSFGDVSNFTFSKSFRRNKYIVITKPYKCVVIVVLDFDSKKNAASLGRQ